MKWKLPHILILGVGLLLLSAGIWRVGQSYIYLLHGGQLAAKKNTNSDLSGEKDSVLLLPEIQFWTAQTGVFKNEANADKERSRLNLLGFKAEFFSASPWAVGIGMAESEAELKVLRDQLTDSGINTVSKKIVIQEKEFKISGHETKNMSEILKNVNNLIRSDNSENSLNPETLISSVQYEELDRIKADLKAISESNIPIDKLQLKLRLYSDYQALISKLSK